MSQDEQRPGDRGQNRLKPKGEGQGKTPKFNIYWVWAIIFAVLVGFQLLATKHLKPNRPPASNFLIICWRKGM